jgi:hypothetical protein
MAAADPGQRGLACSLAQLNGDLSTPGSANLLIKLYLSGFGPWSGISYRHEMKQYHGSSPRIVSDRIELPLDPSLPDEWIA